jgi:rSAM-partnered protein
MVEKPERSRIGDHERADGAIEWEVFVRAETSEPLQHVGSVTAPSADIAHEEATKLFAWYASDVWLCPAGEMHRYSTHDLDAAAQPTPVETGEESRTHEL